MFNLYQFSVRTFCAYRIAWYGKFIAETIPSSTGLSTILFDYKHLLPATRKGGICICCNYNNHTCAYCY